MNSPATAAMTTDQPAAGTAPATPATPATEQPWYAGHADENIRNWAANKGWKDPLAALESGYNLEKLIGFEKAGRTIVMPKDDATPEERRAFLTRIGVPEKVDGYKVPEAFAADPLVAKFRELAHAEGMMPGQFEKAIAFVTGESQAMQKAAQEKAAVQGEQDMASLKTEWGAAYDQHIELGKRAAAQFIPAKDASERAEILGKIESAIGTGQMLRLFAKIGEGLGEHRMVSTDDPGGYGVMTPGQARARIEALKQDKVWGAAYLAGDAAKRQEMERLMKFAYPEA